MGCLSFLSNVQHVSLQGHVDMVTEKNNDVNHDFFNDPLRLRSDGSWLKVTQYSCNTPAALSAWHQAAPARASGQLYAAARSIPHRCNLKAPFQEEFCRCRRMAQRWELTMASGWPQRWRCWICPTAQSTRCRRWSACSLWTRRPGSQAHLTWTPACSQVHLLHSKAFHCVYMELGLCSACFGCKTYQAPLLVPVTPE